MNVVPAMPPATGTAPDTAMGTVMAAAVLAPRSDYV